MTAENSGRLTLEGNKLDRESMGMPRRKCLLSEKDACLMQELQEYLLQ